MGEITSRVHIVKNSDNVSKYKSKNLTALINQLNTVIVGKPAQAQDCVACLLADKINRHSPKTQIVLPQGMEEKQVMVKGATRPPRHGSLRSL